MTTIEESIVQIPLEQLHESPFNPRQIFNETALQELAANIKAEGRVLQPLLARPAPSTLKIVPDPEGGLTDEEVPGAGFEIVFGHRRFRAAQLAGLAAIPCMVRTMTDDEARRAQIAENLQRADVHPIEEAEGFQALIDHHNETADRIAEQCGKSRSYVYGRLKLLDAVPEIRKACLAGEIGSEVALLIARLRTEKLQTKALGYIKGKYISLEDGGGKSFRQIRDLLNERFTLELKSAMFDVEDEMLLPAAGHCVRCPKRSGNAPEYVDVAFGRKNGAHPYSGEGHLKHVGADVCTDPDCFDAKKKAHLAREAGKLAEKGKTMVTGSAARAAISADGEIKGAYLPLAKVKDALKKASKASDVAIITIQDPRTGKTHQAVKVEDAKAAGLKVAAPKVGSEAREADRQKREQYHQEREARAKLETSVNLAIFDKVRAVALERPRDTADMQLIARVAWETVDWNDRQALAKLYGTASADAMEKHIGQMDAAALAIFMLDCALMNNLVVDGWDLAAGRKPEALLDTAKRYGVDVAAVRAEITGEPVVAAKTQKPKQAKKAKAADPAEASL